MTQESSTLLDREKLRFSQDLAIKCLTNPPIYNNGPSSPAFGGFDGIHYLTKPRSRYEKPFVYTEITGYGVLLCLRLWKWERDQMFLELARRAGDWIVKAQYLGSNRKAFGGFFDRYYKDAGEFYPNLYAYPAAVCCVALTKLYESTDESKYLESALKAAEWLMGVMWHPISRGKGAFKEYYYLAKDTFSVRLYPYEAICTALTLMLLNALLKDERYHVTAEEALSWALRTQTDDGSFPMCYDLNKGKYDSILYTHFIAYTLYNLVGFPLLDLSEMLNNMSYTEKAVKCADWLIRNQDKDGGLFTYYYVSGKHSWHKQSPSVAQAICAWLKVYERTNQEKYKEAAVKATQWLIENQHKTTDKNHLAGALYWIYPNKEISLADRIYGFTDKLTRKIGLIHPHLQFLDRIPTWSVQFAVEALYTAERLLF